MAKFVNRAKMSTATTGTGTLTLGSAVAGYQSFADAGVVDTDAVRYVIEDGDAWEIGLGIYTAGTLTRAVEESSNADAALNLGGDALVFVTVAGADLQELIDFSETFALPTEDGTAGQVMTTDGSGNLTLQDLPPSGPTTEAIASGSLPTGATVVVNADGTVSVVAETTLPQVVGSPTTAAQSAQIAASCYDSNSNRVLVAYRDESGSGLDLLVLGTVSGTSISFGNTVTFAADTSLSNIFSCAFDTIQNKVAIVFSGSFNHLYTAVATISGDNLSVGASIQITSFDVYSAEIDFHAQTGNFIVGFRDTSQNNYPVVMSGVVGSNDELYLSNKTVIESVSASTSIPRCNPNSNNLFVGYTTSSNKVALVSFDGNSFTVLDSLTVGGGSSVYFADVVFVRSPGLFFVMYRNSTGFECRLVQDDGGSLVAGSSSDILINDTTQLPLPRAAYNPTADVIFINYEDPNSSSLVAKIATISDLDLTLGTEFSLGTDLVGKMPNTYFIDTEDVVAIHYILASSPYSNRFIVVRNEYVSTNLTEENFIGFSGDTYSDGQGATIQLIGNVAGSQSGLTPGQKYYVQRDGTLATDPATPSVYAGVAVDVDKLIVKG